MVLCELRIFINILINYQEILSPKLSSHDLNHTQKYKIYVENPFYSKGKTTRQTPNNSTIIKPITIASQV